ncbi:RICIN domain-containing protein [Actinoplanes rectilineatus]|uniref:RICIN domain-containing protein n=1 Tax=Actinoplanes rectilineatus TaxID=113571 RepID=UPI0009FB48B2|nr:RICIN domain-containing protein [Actinoplanes rectilineatus]
MSISHPRHPLRRSRLLAAGVIALVVAGLAVTGATQALAAASGTIVSSANGKCLDVTEGGTANGNQPQMWSCTTGNTNQVWTLADNGQVKGLGKCLDLAENDTADAAVVHLWDCYDSVATQRWAYNADTHDLVSLAANKCLDIKDGNLADGAKLQIWECSGGANQKWTFTGGSTTPTTPPSSVPDNPNNPDLGPNVTVFDPSMPAATIQNKLNTVFDAQVDNQFGDARYALLFKPGSYDADVNVGFFTQVAGLGLTPDQVDINGHVHVEADWWPDGSQNATQNFWRSAEGLSVTPPDGQDRWAVSQAAPYRRMHVRGNLALSDGGWSSGGFIADSQVDGQIQAGSQQQFLTRNSSMTSWSGTNWNHVFVGSPGAPAQQFDDNARYTTVGTTPLVAEKPYLYVDGDGAYQVFVPALRTGTSGVSWANGAPAGTSLPISTFYVVKPGDTAATINAALAAGKNLLVTPGVYHLDQTLNVTRADTVILGLGLATFMPDGGVDAMHIADVDGVKLAGVLFDAGTTTSNTLLQVGPAGSAADHAADPTVLSDVFVRVGGSVAGRATVSVQVNSDDVIGDHAWIWRADHGNDQTVGWDVNTARNGLIVEGDDVTFYGLFVEHYQEYQTIWNGNRGRTYFYQNEMPYDPYHQGVYMNGTTQGWAAYKVGAAVTSHEAWGLGSYCFFSTDPSVVNARAFETPVTSGVRFHDMITVSLGGVGTIAHVINDTGDAARSGHTESPLVSFP